MPGGVGGKAREGLPIPIDMLNVVRGKLPAQGLAAFFWGQVRRILKCAYVIRRRSF